MLFSLVAEASREVGFELSVNRFAYTFHLLFVEFGVAMGGKRLWRNKVAAFLLSFSKVFLSFVSHFLNFQIEFYLIILFFRAFLQFFKRKNKKYLKK